jgi:hypothetical protein
MDNLPEVVPYIGTKEELKKRLKPYYVIHDYTDSVESYVSFRESMYDLIKGCYEHKELRMYPIKFKFYDHDKKFYKLELRHFIVNIFFWYPFVELHNIQNAWTPEFILDCYHDIPKISSKINLLGAIMQDYNVKTTKINYDISEVLYNLRRISGDFSLIMGLNFDAFTIIDTYMNNQEFKDLMETTIEDTMQPSEVERLLHNKEDQLIKLLTGIKEHPIGVILQTGTGIKHKQLVEFLVAQGMKPDISGRTIPIPIKNSTMLGGLKTPSDLFIDGIGKIACRCKTPLIAGNYSLSHQYQMVTI